MGWFNAPKYPGLLLGDDVLDETHAFLRRIAHIYESGIGRKPTCEELRALLEVSLVVNADETLLSGLEELRVTTVQIKTAKRPKRQAYKAGDIFAIPLSDGRYAFGRIMLAGGDDGELIEVFREAASRAVPTPSVLQSKRLFHPVYVNGLSAFRDGAFKIVGTDPGYTPSDLGTLQFFLGSPGDYKICSATGQYRSASDEEIIGLTPMSLLGPGLLARQVEKALGGS